MKNKEKMLTAKFQNNLSLVSDTKELSFSHKLKFSNCYIFVNRRCKPLIFQTKTIHSLKYQRSSTLGCKGIRFEN